MQHLKRQAPDSWEPETTDDCTRVAVEEAVEEAAEDAGVQPRYAIDNVVYYLDFSLFCINS